jgi:hypothetical protein
MHTRTRARTPARTFALKRADGLRCGAWASEFRRRWTPLHWAARKGHAAVVEALLAHGADVHAKDSSGCGGRPGRSAAHTQMRVCARAHTRAHAHATMLGGRASARIAGCDTCIDFIGNACILMLCLCESTRTYAHKHLQRKAQTRARTRTHTHTHARADRFYTKTQTQARASARTDSTYSLLYAYVYTFLHTPTHIAMCMYLKMRAYMDGVCACVGTRTQLRTEIHTRTHP